MPLSHITKVFATEDCKISKLTADPTGGSATYATSVDVPGIRSVAISGSVDKKELRGDNTLLDIFAKLTDITVAVSHAKMSLDVLPVILGGTTADAGTTPAQTATYDLLSTSAFNYFKVEAKTPTNGADTVTGDIHFVLHKLILTDFPDLGTAEEDYREMSFTAGATPLAANGKWLSIVANETSAVIT